MPFKRNQLRYFVAVADEGQMTRAAEKLHVAQPALSQSIAQLESQLGVSLFERNARGVTLTPGGEVFLLKARVAVDAGLEAARTAESLARSFHGSIVWGYTSLPPWLADPELIGAFTASHPDVQISLESVPFPSVPAASWLADVDVAISAVLSRDPDVWVEHLCSYPRALLVADGHRFATRAELSVAEILDETFVSFEPSVDPVFAGSWSLDEQRGGPPRNATVETSRDAQARFRMIAAGIGVSSAPATHATTIGKSVPGVTSIPLPDADPVVVSLVGHERHGNPAVTALIEAAKRRSAGS